MRQGLVIVEVALSLMLLVGAGLLARSFLNLSSVNPGFKPANTTVVSLTLSEGRDGEPSQLLAVARQLAEKFRPLPGVTTVGLTHSLALVNNWGYLFFVKDRPRPAAGDEPSANYFAVTPDYFQAMGIRLLRGRVFAESDGEKSAPVCIINETMARKYFGDLDPLGQHIQITNGNTSFREVVGIVADVKDGGLDETVVEQIYDPFAQAPSNQLNFVIRTDGPASPAMLRLLRPLVRSVDDSQPVSAIKPLVEIVAATTERQRFATTLLGVFAAIAFVIAAVGIFGAMAYSVSRRTAEIGIRMALGASRRNVLQMVLRQGMVIVLVGIGGGLAACLALTRVMQSMLFNLDARDPATFALVAFGFAVVALVACFLPALRATKINPLTALRAE